MAISKEKKEQLINELKAHAEVQLREEGKQRVTLKFRHEMAEKYGCSVSYISNLVCQELGMVWQRKWTLDERRFIRDHYGVMTAHQLAQRFHCRETTITQMVYNMRIGKYKGIEFS